MTDTIARLKAKAALYAERAHEAEKRKQARCKHPLEYVVITQGAVSSSRHQEIYLRCELCNISLHRDVTLHDDYY